MLKLIIGVKGTGKTKQLIELVNNTAAQSKGSVVCIEKGTKLTYDIKHTARLIDTEEYAVADAQALYGFIAGILASNHDVTDLFVDSALKICGNDSDGFDKFLNQLSALLEGIKDCKAVSASPVSEKADASYWFLRLIFNADAVTCDKATFAKALAAEGIGANTYYAATPFTSDWYQNSIVFGDSGYPWAAPEYTGDKAKRYNLDDVPVAKKALEDTLIIYPNESWTEANIAETVAAMKKVYEAYKK